MMQTIKKIALMFAGILSVSAVNAQSVIAPPGEGPTFAWDFFTLGNGEVLFSILNAVSLMVNSGTFSDIITIIALIGIFIAAVMGGFNPGQNAIKMVTYFLMVFFVIVVTFQISINVKIQDQVTGYENVVPDVPAVIGFPAVFVSAVGHGIAEVVETAVNIPEGLGVTSGGGFMLIPSMMADMSKIQINDPNLQASMANYSMDCVVAGVANGSINPKEIPISADLWATLAYPNEGILTRYIEKDGNQVTASVVSCKDAHAAISARLDEIAPELLSQGMGAWASTGAVAFASAALDNSLTWITNGGAPTGGAQTLKQSAVISAYSDSFAKGAAMTNNNEMLMSLTMEQALASQKTGWFTAAEIFKNTMGYIYSVLQAFIFGITPIVAAMLLIPGLGTKIFMNYAQILIWLVLWEPMLTIVNFIISVFTRQQVGPIFVGGMDMANKPVVTEFSNNLILAGSFLMTLVPVISWGLVKGGMAFTEFISAGLGSSFSSMAATQAVSGNINMNNMSMNNMSMGQRNLASQTSVGYQQTQGFYGAGAGLSEQQGGGNTAELNGSKIANKTAVSGGMTAAQKEAAIDKLSNQISQQESNLRSTAESAVKSYGTDGNFTQSASATLTLLDQAQQQLNAQRDEAVAQARSGGGKDAINGQVQFNTKDNLLGKAASLLGVSASGGISYEAFNQKIEEAKKQVSLASGNSNINSTSDAVAAVNGIGTVMKYGDNFSQTEMSQYSNLKSNTDAAATEISRSQEKVAQISATKTSEYNTGSVLSDAAQIDTTYDARTATANPNNVQVMADNPALNNMPTSINPGAITNGNIAGAGGLYDAAEADRIKNLTTDTSAINPSAAAQNLSPEQQATAAALRTDTAANITADGEVIAEQARTQPTNASGELAKTALGAAGADTGTLPGAARTGAPASTGATQSLIDQIPGTTPQGSILDQIPR